jgi:hypothetical protein
MDLVDMLSAQTTSPSETPSAQILKDDRFPEFVAEKWRIPAHNFQYPHLKVK